MKIKLLLIIAVTAATLFLVVGTIKQAHAYNLLVTVGAQKVENIVKLSKKDDEVIIQENEQAGVEEEKQEDVAKVEPAAGE